MAPDTAFVLGGGGVLGATQIGMLRALLDRNINPDLVVGSSVGALNGAMVAADPTPAGMDTLVGLWTELSQAGVFSGSVVSQAARLAKYRTHLHSAEPLRRLLERHLPTTVFEELPVRFECVAASIETAAAHWFTHGDLPSALIASCSVPGLFPPARIGAEHFLDGGLVHSIPVGRAVQLGARRIFVLHVGRIEQALRPPRWPWEVGLVSFEIARRHRFVEEMAALPDSIEVHVLPSGGSPNASINLRYRDTSRAASRIDCAHRASTAYLDGLG